MNGCYHERKPGTKCDWDVRIPNDAVFHHKTSYMYGEYIKCYNLRVTYKEAFVIIVQS